MYPKGLNLSLSVIFVTVLWVLEWRLIFNSPAFCCFEWYQGNTILSPKEIRYLTEGHYASSTSADRKLSYRIANLPLFIKYVYKPNIDISFCSLPYFL